MDAQELRNLHEAYLEVYQELDEVTGGGYIPPTGTTYAGGDANSDAQIRRNVHRNTNWTDRSSQEKSLKDAGIRSRTSRTSREIIPSRNIAGTTRSPGGTESGLSMPPATRMQGRAKSLEAKGLTKSANKIRAVLSRVTRSGGSSSLSGIGRGSATDIGNNTVTGRYVPGAGGRFGISGIGLADSYDYYDVILSYLLDEGYADTDKAAIAIMANMSEEWRQSIMEGPAGMLMSAASRGMGSLQQKPVPSAGATAGSKGPVGAGARKAIPQSAANRAVN